MNYVGMLLTVLGLCLFETISSIDNAIINAEVIGTMSAKARKWFLTWGLIFAVVLVRGLLPWLIVWFATPGIGPIDAFTATFSGDPKIMDAVERSAPILLAGGGTFLIFLFFHWLFLEDKHFGLPHEKFFLANGIWFYSFVSIFLATISWFMMKINPMIAFGAMIGSSAFFITHGFKQNAEKGEEKLVESHMSDLSKILFLEVIDATFSIDGVLGAFAFTLSVPLILLGNGLGAYMVRKITMGNVERIKRYVFLKNGAMYSILVLGFVMLTDSFGIHVPEWISPVLTFAVVGFFLLKSKKALEAVNEII